MTTMLERLAALPDTNSCIDYPGYLDRGGYGQVRVNRHTRLAHRVSRGKS